MSFITPKKIFATISAHSCPGRVRRHVRTWRKQTSHSQADPLGQPTEPCFVHEISSDLGSNVVSELLGLFEQVAGVIGVFLRCLCHQGRGDGLSELGEVGTIWTGLDARRDHCVMLSPIRSTWPARRACQFVHRLMKFLNKVLRAG